MSVIANRLDERQIEDAAEYFSSLEPAKGEGASLQSRASQ